MSTIEPPADLPCLRGRFGKVTHTITLLVRQIDRLAAVAFMMRLDQQQPTYAGDEADNPGAPTNEAARVHLLLDLLLDEYLTEALRLMHQVDLVSPPNVVT